MAPERADAPEFGFARLLCAAARAVAVLFLQRLAAFVAAPQKAHQDCASRARAASTASRARASGGRFAFAGLGAS